MNILKNLIFLRKNALPAKGNIYFILPKKKISKEDPYGEEIWDEE